MKKNLFYSTMILMASLLFVACAAKGPTGTFTGTADGFKGPVEVNVTLNKGNIMKAELVSFQDSDFAQPAVDAILNQAVQTGSIKNLDTVSGATYTSKGVISALEAAMIAAQGATTKTKKTVTDETTDVVIIGAGGAGLSAAVEARNKGSKVIVLEKMAIAGGNTNYATGGLNASETSVQKTLKIADSNEQFYKDTMEGGKNINNPELVRNMVEKSAETVDWLTGLGMDLSDVGKMAGSTNSRTHRPTGGAAIGSHFTTVMVAAAEKVGVDIRYNSKVTGLVNKNGTVAGVKVSTPDGDYTITSKAVVIATGGFGANPELIVAYKPSLEGFGTTNHAGATGDAFAWVKEFNASLTDIEEIQTHPTVVPVKNLMITEAVRGNGAIMINREGKRFCQEMATRDVMSEAILNQTGKTAFLMFDQGVRESLKAIETYAQQGLLTEGATLAELATKLNIDEKSLEATVNAYNGFVTGKKDADFGRADLPRKIATGPFYAVEVEPAVHHTMGGLTINVNTEVLDTNVNAFPGLFAAGEVTGGIHGANRLGGNAVADIAIYGKIAGNSAASYAKK